MASHACSTNHVLPNEVSYFYGKAPAALAVLILQALSRTIKSQKLEGEYSRFGLPSPWHVVRNVAVCKIDMFLCVYEICGEKLENLTVPTICSIHIIHIMCIYIYIYGQSGFMREPWRRPT